ncbi:MAG: hypothetical protein AABW59_03380 [archaeon]
MIRSRRGSSFVKWNPPSSGEWNTISKSLGGGNKAFGVKEAIIGLILFFGIIYGNYISKFSIFFEGQIFKPILDYFQVLCIILFVVYLALLSRKQRKLAHKSVADVKAEMKKLNIAGDGPIFEGALVDNKLTLFDGKKKLLFVLIIPFCFLMLTVGILALHLVFFNGMGVFLVPGFIVTILALGPTFMFFYEDKRILNEARRRNQFVDVAEKRWFLTKAVYVGVIILSLVVAGSLVVSGNNFVARGDLYSGSSLIYAGIDYHKDIADCFESSYPGGQLESCNVSINGEVEIYRLLLQVDKQIRAKALRDQNVVLGEYAIDYCLINKNEGISDNFSIIRARNSSILFEAKCTVGSPFEYLPEDENLMDFYCRNYRNCYGPDKICCLGVFN